MRRYRLYLTLTAAFVGCGPATPEAQNATRIGQTTVTVHRGAYDESDSPSPLKQKPSSEIALATALEPPAKPSATGASHPLIGGSVGEGPLPLPTTLATTRNALFVFGRTRAGYVVRVFDNKTKKPAWSAPVVVTPAFEDDAPAVAAGDGDGAWFSVSSKSGLGLRLAHVDVTGKLLNVVPRDDGKPSAPTKLGRIATLVPLKGHVVAIGRDGDAITFARLMRNGTFFDTTAKQIAKGSASMSTTESRSPRAVAEEDKVLLAWDGDDVAGALDTPGTTPAEKLSPKSGIYVRRFNGNGEPASPARRLTRPGFEAHALDVVVELGACAVLASTPDGFEMFRFVRKGDDLGPYGGGLHLAGPGGDVSLSTDLFGTLAVTPTKLLRIGPGVKIVTVPLGVAAPNGGNFDEVRVSNDGYGAHVLLSTKSSLGLLSTIAKIDGSAMGGTLPTPWVGPPPQRLIASAIDGDEGLALVIDAGSLHAVRFGLDGTPRSENAVPFDSTKLEPLVWPRAPVPRLARAGAEWIVTLSDGRVLVATGAKAGTFVVIPSAKGTPVGGVVALAPSGGREKAVRAVYLPPTEKGGALATGTIDPITATMPEHWTAIPESERHYGALNGARWAALPRAQGGLWLVTNSGQKVSLAAQLYELVAIGGNGAPVDASLLAPGSLQEITLIPSTGGAALVATLTGKGVIARWLDAGGGWKDSFSFTPFRVQGDGPTVRDKGVGLGLGRSALPFELGPELTALVGERCPVVMPTGDRSMLLACEEGSGETPLAARATLRLVTF